MTLNSEAAHEVEIDCAVKAKKGQSDYESQNKIKSNVVYGFFLLLGLGTLLPWNFFITAESYWQYKFRNTTDPDWPDHPRTHLQDIYAPMQVCFAQITNFTLLILNAVFSHLASKKVRLLSSLSVMIVFFIATTALVKIDTDSWQNGFFSLTMLIIVGLNASAAIFQGGLFGIAGMFPARYICAVLSGQALGGVFASASRIVSQAVGADNVISALIYFGIAVAVLFIKLACCVYMLKMPFYQHYALVTYPTAESSENGTRTAAPAPKMSVGELFGEQKRMFRYIWPYALSVASVFFITLAVFPVICVRVISLSDNLVWRDTYFQSTITFLLFNVGDYVGRQTAGVVCWPGRGSRLLYLFVGLRIVFIPLFLLCNHDPNSNVPSVFIHDAWYISFMAFFALSNGYLSTLCMMYAPSLVPETDCEKASSMMAAMIGLGLLSGSLLSFAFALIS